MPAHPLCDHHFSSLSFSDAKIAQKIGRTLAEFPELFFSMDACKLNADPQCSTKKKIDSAQIKQYKRVKGNTFKSVCNTFLINWPIKQNHSFLRPFTVKWRDNEHCECFWYHYHYLPTALNSTFQANYSSSYFTANTTLSTLVQFGSI